MRKGEACDLLLRAFEVGAEAGADILSIESVGGKEVHDKALVVADIPAIALGPRRRVRHEVELRHGRLERA